MNILQILHNQESHTVYRFPRPAAKAAIFGITLMLWLFQGTTAVADEAYRLGAGDRIVITVFGEDDLSMNFFLNDTGKLNYPFLGELNVAGLTVTELEQLITSGLKGPYLVNPEVSVSISEYRSFFVHGEVRKPGAFAFQPGLTLEKAVALAGGFTDRAARKKITVIRGGDPGAAPERIVLSARVFPGDIITVQQSFF